MAAKPQDPFDAASEKCDSNGFEALNEKEQIIYTVCWFGNEVNNGGFQQCFDNSAGDHADTAVESLIKIGAPRASSLLQKAINIAFDGKLPRSREDRQNQLKVGGDIKNKEIDVLNSEFYQNAEGFYKMVYDYVET